VFSMNYIMLQQVIETFRFLNVNKFGGSHRFLTFINHEFQTIYALLSFVVDIYFLMKTKTRNSSGSIIRDILDRVFFLNLILSSMVGIIFWSIFFYEKELIMTKQAEQVYTVEQNIYQHGIVAINMWLEMLLIPHFVSQRFLTDVSITFLFCITYIIWVFLNANITGSFPYPFMNLFTPMQHVLFYAVVLSLTGVVLVIFRTLLAMRWRYYLAKEKLQ